MQCLFLRIVIGKMHELQAGVTDKYLLENIIKNHWINTWRNYLSERQLGFRGYESS